MLHYLTLFLLQLSTKHHWYLKCVRNFSTHVRKLCFRIKILLVYKNESLNSKIELNNP